MSVRANPILTTRVDNHHGNVRIVTIPPSPDPQSNVDMTADDAQSTDDMSLDDLSVDDVQSLDDLSLASGMTSH